jgi:hypothetical protein
MEKKIEFAGGGSKHPDILATYLYGKNDHVNGAVMKRALMIFVMFVLGLGSAHAVTHYELHFQGSQQPYICVACSLRIPYPDKETLAMISAWQNGETPFADSRTHEGIKHTIVPGDVVNVCNTCGCAAYTMDDSKILGTGVFMPMESHPAGGAPTRPKGCPKASS